MQKDGRGAEPRFKEETQVQKGIKGDKELSRKPVWGQEMWMHLKANECNNTGGIDDALLCFEVYDDDHGKLNRKIGEATIDLWDVVTTPDFISGDARWLSLIKGKPTDAGGQDANADAGAATFPLLLPLLLLFLLPFAVFRLLLLVRNGCWCWCWCWCCAPPRFLPSFSFL